MRQHIKKVEDLMTTNLVTIYEDQTLDIANFEMELGQLRHMPVVSRQHPERLEGIVTHRDLLRVAGRAYTQDAPHRRDVLRQVPVAEIMRRNVETARTSEPAAAAARRMLERKIGCLPVVDERGSLVGIVTESDFVAYAADSLEGA
jgi:CBS domain-containing protein